MCRCVNAALCLCLHIYVGDRFVFLLFVFRYWLSVGAQPSNPVERLLFRAGLLPPPPTVAMARKGGARDTRPVDALTGRVIDQQKPPNSNNSEASLTENP